MKYDFESKFNREYNPITRKIIRLLSSNSRITVSEIAKELKMSRSTIASRLKKIEDAFQIKYTLRFNPRKLGLLNPHMILVRFGKKPDYEQVKRALGRTYHVQFAARIKGTYDLLIYANAYSLPEYLTWDMRMRSELMPSYSAKWQSSDVSFFRLGFPQIRNEVLDRAKLPKRQREMLKILNQNSRISFKELSRSLGMNYKTTVYNFNKLVKSEYMLRF
ncbi:MAG: winged helix-turn-helix transcriptional regulator, partial [Candidatus Micrarchaeota archaeon]|nr:winged helix-turn-helix transcriptional regulator [Candidatus Micrarchaeota archaeon]